MLSLSSSFRTGIKHTQPTVTHLHIQQSRWRVKIIPFFFLHRQLKSTEEQWAAILLFSWWINIVFKAFQWYECAGKTRPTGDAAKYQSYKEFIIWKAFCSSNLNAELSWQEFCRADGSSKLLLSDLFSSAGAREQASLQKVAVLNQPIVTQGAFNFDNFFTWMCGMANISCSWQDSRVKLSENVSPFRKKWGSGVKGETEALICKWVKGEQGRWRDAPYCGWNQRAPVPLAPPAPWT